MKFPRKSQGRDALAGAVWVLISFVLAVSACSHRSPRQEFEPDAPKDQRASAAPKTDSESKAGASPRKDAPPKPRAKSKTSAKSSAKTSSKPSVNKKEARKSAQQAVIQTDGALLYQQPDFDANIVGNLALGQKVLASTRTFGKLAQFYRVKIGKQIGFVADIDLVLPKSSFSEPSADSAGDAGSEEEGDNFFQGADAVEPGDVDGMSLSVSKERLPMYFSRFVGVSVGQTNFKDSRGGDKGELVYGLKVTGPDLLLEGPVLDFNVVLHFGAPSYYKALSSSEPTGYLLFTDAMLLIPFFQNMNSMFYIGAGPLLILSSFEIVSNNTAQSFTSLNVGLNTSIGYGWRWGNYAIRLEGRYHIEKHSYQGVLASVQMGF